MENKIALITGGSRGLGKETAFRLAEKGLQRGKASRMIHLKDCPN